MTTQGTVGIDPDAGTHSPDDSSNEDSGEVIPSDPAKAGSWPDTPETQAEKEAKAQEPPPPVGPIINLDKFRKPSQSIPNPTESPSPSPSPAGSQDPETELGPPAPKDPGEALPPPPPQQPSGGKDPATSPAPPRTEEDKLDPLPPPDRPENGFEDVDAPDVEPEEESGVMGAVLGGLGILAAIGGIAYASKKGWL